MKETLKEGNGIIMKDKLLQKFAELFGDSEGVKVYFAPGRVNMIGEHTDYNGGHVFPCALTIGTFGAARKRNDNELHLFSMNFEKMGVVETTIDEFKQMNNWTDYPRGVMWAFEGRGMKMTSGMDLVLYGNIPNGSGLSSSASLEVLTGFILRDIYGFDVTNTDLALIGQYSENNFNGMNCGIMDQFASAMGKKDNAIFLNTADLSFEYAPLVLEGAKIVVTNSKVKHKLVDSAYNNRRSECERALAELQTVVDIKGLGDLSEEQFEEHKAVILGNKEVNFISSLDEAKRNEVYEFLTNETIPFILVSEGIVCPQELLDLASKKHCLLLASEKSSKERAEPV